MEKEGCVRVIGRYVEHVTASYLHHSPHQDSEHLICNFLLRQNPPING